MTSTKKTFPNEVIRASAGTGKTFQLSNRFLGLVASGEPLDTILATTFTRKGAGEILDRILSRLAEAASDPLATSELARHLSAPTLDPDQPPLDQDRCSRLLSDLIHGLHRLRVGTLDSFFIQMARSFSLELGLTPGWRIVDEIVDDRLKAEAVRAVLQEESATDAVRLMNLLTKGEATRGVAQEITSLVHGLYGIYLEAPAEAWRALAPQKTLPPDELDALVQRLAAVELPGKSFAEAREQDLGNVRAEAWSEVLAKGIGKKVLEGAGTFGRQQIPPEVAAVYEPLVRHARAMLVNQITHQTEATGRLLGRFHAAYEQLKTTRQAMRFDDVTRRLAFGRLNERVGDLAHRLDGRVAHLLFDEFQDTDPLQWRAVRPLAARVTDAKSGHTLFCVGDVKQAIFGWRGGVAEIFDTLTEDIESLATRPLDRSFRSSPTVVDTVNRLFENLADNAALESHAEARDRWSARFHRHTTARTELAGYCRLTVASSAEDDSRQKAETLRFAAAEIARLHRRSPDRTIGVLTRTNASLARLIYELRKLQIEASEEGGNPLTDSPAVGVVLALLQLADHPGDRTARFLVAHSPLAESLGLTHQDDDLTAAELARRIRRQLMNEGYGPTILGWVRPLSAHCNTRDQSRLVQLVELVYGYEATATCRADDFIRVVSQKKVEDPSTASVRVMTLHKAKGLQFDIVVLPELDATLTGRPPGMVVGRPHPTAPIEHVCRYVSKPQQAILPERFQETFRADESRRVEESLCVLYVGLTRAAHALEMIVSPSKPNEKTLPATLAGVLRAGFSDVVPVPPAVPESVLYEHGDPEWFRAASEKPLLEKSPTVATLRESQEPQAPKKSLAPKKPLMLKLATPRDRPTRGLEFSSPSGLEGGPRVDLHARLRLDTHGALDRGTLMHAWFETIRWLESGPPDDRLLWQIADRLDASRLDVPAMIDQFRRMLQRPSVAALLTEATFRQASSDTAGCGAWARPDIAKPRWEVRQEYPFVIRDGDTILRGSIDRLVILHDGQNRVGADIVDFKTDRIGNEETLAERIEQYRPQLDAYHRAAVKLLRLEPARVSARLAFVEPGVVHAVCQAGCE